MTRFAYALLLVNMLTINAKSQSPEDALRYGWYTQQGTARAMALGGTIGTLGGEISSLFVNPAGIGMYKNREFVISPNLRFIQNDLKYRDSSGKTDKQPFALGASGFLFGNTDPDRPNRSSAFGFAIQQVASFRNELRYQGFNNYSSFSEQFVESFAQSGYSINDVLNTQSPLPYTVAPALYTYLIDTVSVNGIPIVKAAPEYLLDSGKSIFQDFNRTSRGGMYELAFSFASHHEEKWMYGATLGIPIIYHQQTLTATESDLSGDTTNGFGSFQYTDTYTSNGSGLNLKLGVIYRPMERIRLGLALHSPSMLTFTETRKSSLVVNLENPNKSYEASSQAFTNNERLNLSYAYRTPWRAVLSAMYIFHEVEDIRQQKGFLTGELEYVRQSSGKYSSVAENPSASDRSYYKALTEVLRSNYRGTIHARVGGELKFNVWMVRGGFAYYGNPYEDRAFNAQKTILSGGLGYRNHGFFLDLTYVHQWNSDVDLPYRLSDRANTFATLQQQTGLWALTFGLKF